MANFGFGVPITKSMEMQCGQPI